MRRTPVCVAALLLLSPAPNALAQTCPLNLYSAGASNYYVEDSSTAPSWNFGPFNYDLVHGTFAGALQGSGEGGAFAQITLQDRYTIVGPSTVTPLTFHVRVHVSGIAGADMVTLPFLGTVCLGSSGTFSVASGALAEEVQVSSYDPGACASVPFDETVELELTKIPGEEFPLRVGAHHSAGHLISISVTGTITFENLPEGYEMRSCYGYAGIPVPAVARSWGSLKGMYR